MIDYPCGKFVDCSFSRFGFIVRACDRHTQTDADERFTPVTLVGVSNYVAMKSKITLVGLWHVQCDALFTE